MCKIIPAVVLLATLVATSTVKAKIDVAKFKKCLEHDLAKLSQIEVPPEIVEVQRRIYDLDEFLSAADGFSEYTVSLSEQKQTDLKKAAKKYADETESIINDGPCARKFSYLKRFLGRKTSNDDYFNWIYRDDTKVPAKQKYMTLTEGAELARFIRDEFN